MLQILERRRKYIGVILSDELILTKQDKSNDSIKKVEKLFKRHVVDGIHPSKRSILKTTKCFILK